MYKLAFVSDTLPFCHHNFSGAELSCEYVSKNNEEDNTEVFYLTSRKDFDCDEKVYELPKSHSKEFPVDLHILIKIIKIFRIEKPDYVYLYTKKYLQPSIIACFLLHIPMIYSVVDYHILCPHNILIRRNGNLCTGRRGWYCRLRHIWFSLLIKMICSNYGLFWTFTRTSETRMEQWGIPKGRIDVEYQIGLPEKIKPVKLPKPSVVFIGSHSPHKGISVVVEAFRLLKKSMPNISCFMIGDDSFHQYNDIKAVGHVTHDVALGYIAGADAVIVSEQWYSDFGSIVVYGAKKLGVPVVAGNIGSASEFTSHIVQYDNPQQYKDELLKVLNEKIC